jgi:hypothetical protein
MKERRAGSTQASPYYDAARCHAFVCDVAATALDPPVPPATVDVAVLIFALSAMRPAAMPAVLARIYTALRPGGLLLFRDYGRYDLAQLRFRDRHVLDTNFYARGDGTRVYFFTEGMRPTPASLPAPACVRTSVCRVVPRCMQACAKLGRACVCVCVSSGCMLMSTLRAQRRRRRWPRTPALWWSSVRRTAASSSTAHASCKCTVYGCRASFASRPLLPRPPRRPLDQADTRWGLLHLYRGIVSTQQRGVRRHARQQPSRLRRRSHPRWPRQAALHMGARASVSLSRPPPNA